MSYMPGSPGWKRLICWLIGHAWEVNEPFIPDYRCRRCGALS